MIMIFCSAQRERAIISLKCECEYLSRPTTTTPPTTARLPQNHFITTVFIYSFLKRFEIERWNIENSKQLNHLFRLKSCFFILPWNATIDMYIIVDIIYFSPLSLSPSQSRLNYWLCFFSFVYLQLNTIYEAIDK